MAQRFGRYWLHEKIGLGGMAEVWRATLGPDEHTFAFEIAVKMLLPHLARDKATVDMFRTEADIAKLLRHPNIVQVYESGVIDGQTYISMEYVWGTDLATLVETLRKKRLRFPPELALFVAMQVLRALDYVHRAKSAAGEPMDIVHRDVTPSNVYVTYDGQVKLADFGIARVNFLEERDDPMLKGKVAYMPPEVLRGGHVDQTADLWGIAVTLWELLTTTHLHEGVPDSDLVKADPPPVIHAPHEINADVPEDLSLIVARALSPKKKKRPRDAVELYRDLKLYVRDSGLKADAAALGRFVSALTGKGATAQPARAPVGPATGIFERPSYQVPVGMSPTQRFEIVMRKRRVLWPVLAAGVAVGAAGGSAAAWQLLRSRAPEPTGRPAAVAATPPAPVSPPVAVEPPASTDSRARPGGPDGLADDPAWSGNGGKTGPKVEAAMQRARTQARRQKYAAAEATYRELLAAHPRHVPAILGRADVLLQLERYPEAEEAARSALALEPRSPAAHLLLGDALWMQRHDKDARAAYQRCVELAPGSKSAQTARRILSKL